MVTVLFHYQDNATESSQYVAAYSTTNSSHYSCLRVKFQNGIDQITSKTTIFELSTKTSRNSILRKFTFKINENSTTIIYENRVQKNVLDVDHSCPW